MRVRRVNTILVHLDGYLFLHCARFTQMGHVMSESHKKFLEENFKRHSYEKDGEMVYQIASGDIGSSDQHMAKMLKDQGLFFEESSVEEIYIF